MSEADDMTVASVPVASVVTGEGIHAVAAMAVLMGYRTWGQTGMILARNLHPTVRDFNAMSGHKCRTRAEVGAAADVLIKSIRAERDAK